MLREEFRRSVFERDNFKCVNCGKPAVDAHHLIERRLWSDGGYIVDNGVSLCADCHLLAEQTDLNVDDLRAKAGIMNVVLPEQMYADEMYDKWGNQILSNGHRLRGELFYDESVQRVLAKHFNEFLPYVKYPRTYHLPWSNALRDDRTMDSVAVFEGKEVVITEKMDGENTSMYFDYIHARSIYGRHHPSRSWIKNFHSKIAIEIPVGWRLCGENLYARHSIAYDSLPTYFMGFSLWDNNNVCLAWDETLEYFELMGITPVPTLYRGMWDEARIKNLSVSTTREGYVVRIVDSFRYTEFRNSVAKYVRPNHVTTQEHWMFNRIEKNKLKETV